MYIQTEAGISIYLHLIVTFVLAYICYTAVDIIIHKKDGLKIGYSENLFYSFIIILLSLMFYETLSKTHFHIYIFGYYFLLFYVMFLFILFYANIYLYHYFFYAAEKFTKKGELTPLMYRIIRLAELIKVFMNEERV